MGFPKSLAGKTALLTGATGRTGRAIALALADAGANVVAHYCHNATDAESLCGLLRASGVKAVALQADLGDPGAAETLIAKTLDLVPGIDLLVNSASTFAAGTPQELTWAALQSSVLVNAWSPFALGRAFSRCPGASAMVNLLDSRITGTDGAHAGYILSKHLLAAMTDLMALAFAPAVRVNAVAPGLVAGEGVSAESACALPLARPVDPREVAETVVFLLKSRSITGQVLYVDGGRQLRERAHA